MKTIALIFSFFVVTNSVANDVEKKKAEQKAREIERAALFLQEQQRPEEKAPEGWIRPNVQKQWQRNEQWKDDSKDFNIVEFFLSEGYEKLKDNDKSQSYVQPFRDEFGDIKYLSFKKKNGFIIEFSIYKHKDNTKQILDHDEYNTKLHHYELKCHANSPEVKIVNDAIKYKRKGPNIGMSTNFSDERKCEAFEKDAPIIEESRERTICSWYWYPFAWLLYGNGVARWLGYGTKIAKKATIKEPEDDYYAVRGPATGDLTLVRFQTVETNIKGCLTQQVKDALEKKANKDELDSELRYPNLRAAYDAYCFALLSFEHRDAKENERKVANIFDGFLEAKKSGAWKEWGKSLPNEWCSVTNGFDSKPANVEQTKLTCMKVYNAYETLILAAHNFFEEAQKVAAPSSNIYPIISTEYSYKDAFRAVEHSIDARAKEKFDPIFKAITALCKINTSKEYHNIFDADVMKNRLATADFNEGTVLE